MIEHAADHYVEAGRQYRARLAKTREG
jgi:hypothetical protein